MSEAERLMAALIPTATTADAANTSIRVYAECSELLALLIFMMKAALAGSIAPPKALWGVRWRRAAPSEEVWAQHYLT